VGVVLTIGLLPGWPMHFKMLDKPTQLHGGVEQLAQKRGSYESDQLRAPPSYSASAAARLPGFRVVEQFPAGRRGPRSVNTAASLSTYSPERRGRRRRGWREAPSRFITFWAVADTASGLRRRGQSRPWRPIPGIDQRMHQCSVGKSAEINAGPPCRRLRSQSLLS